MATSTPLTNPTPPTTTTTTTKRKSSPSDSPSTPQTIHFTARTPTWTYLKLQLITHDITPTLDPLTARTYLSAALTQFLGLTGTAIPIDILKVFTEQRTPTLWTRVPRDDASAVVAALSSWIGGGASTNGGGDAAAGNVAWRVCAKGNYLGALVQGSGGELFVP
ncbi:uncharacterized protein BO80DRAFT_396388 [Aspergillus ibericus CBS 121593]|uniref:Ribonucleases P/MRP subunit Pop8-like domain-containing protein n=1 Tax=Aspergillus ibericus CBS 121593 TaxID=1448316 RepID=A0A395HD08_9EURO|nr:hypothetical protein BO80DRAFT_396388 [Aspergillus ibericus CBS 121593]RAL05546.1 hypothetical protein BO80DRAFT_396388 [Aspergillus ibericus CBS 121593]